MFFDENDLGLIFRFNGKRKKFINEYNISSLNEMKINNIKSIKTLLDNLYKIKEKLGNERNKKKIENEIKKIEECLKANEEFNVTKWIREEKPSYFSQMKAKDFKLDYLTNSFNNILGYFKMCNNSKDSIEYKDGKVMIELLNLYNDCFKNIGIFGFNIQMAEQLISLSTDIEPQDMGFDVDYSDETINNEDFIIYKIPFFIQYPRYRSIDNKLVEYVRLPISFGKIIYNESYIDKINDTNKKKL